MKTRFALTALLSLLFIGRSIAQPGEIWIVRHAEKITSDSQNNDPALSTEGVQRAADLAAYLSKAKIAGIYATPFIRCAATAAPLSKQFNVPVQTYDPANPAALVKAVNTGNTTGKAVVVIGHSNTVPGLIQAFGGKAPMTVLDDEDYDYIFKLTLLPGNQVTTSVFQYGKAHRKK